MKIKFFTAVLFLIQLSASACNVPVFRYALERWPVAPYRAVILKKSELSKEEKAAYTQLKKSSDGESGMLNLALWIPKKEDMETSGLAKIFPGELPADATIHLMYPLATGVDKPFWSGKLTKGNASKIIKSSFRSKLVKTILEGNSGVYVLMESGNKKKDNKIAKELDGYIKMMIQNMELPPGVVTHDGAVTGDQAPDFDPINQLRSKIPLKLAFEILRYDRKSDEIMTALLMGVGPDHEEPVEGKPMVFAVYGRGRVLAPMVGEEINMDNVSSIAFFFSGACSCQMKALNPGTDLLLDHDWDSSVFGVEE